MRRMADVDMQVQVKHAWHLLGRLNYGSQLVASMIGILRRDEPGQSPTAAVLFRILCCRFRHL